jgi:hypothetical protein
MQFVQGFQPSEDLRGFVERNHERADDPQVAHSVAYALEECAELRPLGEDRSWVELAAASALAEPCRGFDGQAIEPLRIVTLLARAAENGEPHALARMLLFRDIAAPKSEVMADIPILLATRDPAVIRDVGAFLSKGESAWRFGSEEVESSAAAIAWELAACDLGYACGPASRLMLALCAFDGRCESGYYEDALMRYEPPELMAQAQRLRDGILRALRDHDWAWLGLTT